MSVWESSIADAGFAAAERCERQPGKRTIPSSAPRTAFCLSGAARAFSSPLVLTALRANLIVPLAGQRAATSGSRLFLSLKLSDSAKHNVGGVSFGQHHAQAAPLLDALTGRSAPWLSHMLGAAVIINGSGAHLADEGLPYDDEDGLDGRISFVRADHGVWKHFRARSCTDDASSYKSHRVPATKSIAAAAAALAGGASKSDASDARPAPSASSSKTDRACCRKSSYLLEGNNEERLIHQHLGLRWCLGAIHRYEQRHAKRREESNRTVLGSTTRVGGLGLGAETKRDPVRQRWLVAGTQRSAGTPMPAIRTAHDNFQSAARVPRTSSPQSSPLRPSLSSSTATAARTTTSSFAFDLVVFARPDLIWWQPLPAWCDWPWTSRMLACDKPGCDIACGLPYGQPPPGVPLSYLLTCSLQ